MLARHRFGKTVRGTNETTGFANASSAATKQPRPCALMLADAPAFFLAQAGA